MPLCFTASFDISHNDFLFIHRKWFIHQAGGLPWVLQGSKLLVLPESICYWIRKAWLTTKEGILPNKYFFWVEHASTLEKREYFWEVFSVVLFTVQVGVARGPLPFLPNEDVLKDRNNFDSKDCDFWLRRKFYYAQYYNKNPSDL